MKFIFMGISNFAMHGAEATLFVVLNYIRFKETWLELCLSIISGLQNSAARWQQC